LRLTRNGYGRGKSGWLRARFGADDQIPIDRLKAWIDESYRARASKTLIRQLIARSSRKG
jgi:hypothetical protein